MKKLCGGKLLWRYSPQILFAFALFTIVLFIPDYGDRSSGYALYNTKKHGNARLMQDGSVSPYVLFDEQRSPDNSLFDMTLADHDRQQCRKKYPDGLELTKKQKKYMQKQTYFIVFAWTNQDDKLVYFIHELLHAIQFLGKEKVFVSVYESNSSDRSPHLLRLFKDMLVLLEVDHYVHSPFQSPLDETEHAHVEVLSDKPFKPKPKIHFRPREERNRKTPGKPKLRHFGRSPRGNAQRKELSPANTKRTPTSSDLEEKCAKYQKVTELFAKFTEELNVVESGSDGLHRMTEQMLARLDRLATECSSVTSSGASADTPETTVDAQTYDDASPTSSPTPYARSTEHTTEGEGYYYTDRISFLADVRNKSLEPLHFLPRKYTKIIYLNDVFFCWEDIIRLLLLPDADMACALDYDVNRYGIKVYDMWVTRDMKGKMLKHVYPYFASEPEISSIRDNRPFQVLNCWNGLVVMNAEPFYKGIEFRTAREDVADCAASECTHICNDLWANNYYKIAVDPLVSVAYDADVYKDHEPYWVAMSNEGTVTRSRVDWDNPIPWSNVPPPTYECCALELGDIHTEGECHEFAIDWIKEALHK